ncbi:MAG: DEAD/DEAH box helicase [Spirochaetaceae bacterium]|nr:MAG: DEAD/DEAH box helicase [Spirochaetaceae bacterium]
MSDTVTSDVTFSELELITPILNALKSEGYHTPTEIQARAIPVLLAGHDLLGTAQTGGGKTAAFVLPILQSLSVARQLERTFEEPAAAPQRGTGGRRNSRSNAANSRGRIPTDHMAGLPRRRAEAARPAALILAPTRELAMQISQSVSAYGARLKVRHTVVYGGASKNTQARELAQQPEVLVATPGRLLDFINEKAVTLEDVRYLVLDEADRMLDMGFIPDVRRIVAMTAQRRQTTMFSATMPREIADLAAGILKDPVRIECEHGSMRVEAIDHSVMFVDQADKLTLLVDMIERQHMHRAIVFTRTKHRATRVAKALNKQNIDSDAIHGDKTQSARTRALDAFKKGKIQVLVATDVAARGIDVDSISHVINFELPGEAEAETYVHRIGRTGRAGADGSAVSFCSRDEVRSLRAIEQLMKMSVRVDRDHEFHFEVPRVAPRAAGRDNGQSRSGGNGRNAGSRRANGRGPAGGKRPDSRRPRA